MKPPTAEMRFSYELYAALYQAGCDDSDFGRLMAMMMPEDLADARVQADFALCMTMPGDFARMAEHLGMTVAELRRKRDRALERLEAVPRARTARSRGGRQRHAALAVEPGDTPS